MCDRDDGRGFSPQNNTQTIKRATTERKKTIQEQIQAIFIINNYYVP